jgi:pimeloyl-ACP methyl ester carboxylesterase
MAALSQFNYQISGNEGGHKLVFLHGLLGSAANWRRITPAFEDRFHILTYDQRGHGRSFQPSSGYAPQDYAGDLLQILTELGWERIHLVGHSMGGRNALEFAHLYPEKLLSLVVEDIGVEESQEAQDKIFRLLDLVPRPFSSRKEARTFFDQKYPSLIPFEDDPKTMAAYFYSNLTEVSPGVVDWRFSLEGVKESLRQGREKTRWDLIEGLKLPTLYLRGGDSKTFSEKMFQETLRRNPLIQGKVIENAGHWVHFDQPEAFIKALNEFLTLQT